ncbi:T9SS type A sorting domain-containing protein [Labilibacter sediminis]|nr:T9SS type A sorting domain-containing protein [Labilibacter sediminis]
MKSVFVLLLVGILLIFPKQIIAQVLESDSLALVDFYKASGGNWTQTWLKETIDGADVGIKGWEGVTVEREEGSEFYRVTQLNIEGINNNGVFPSGTLSPSIGNLSALTLLYLNGSEKGPRMLDLTGTIPGELWNLSSLKRLKMKYTSLTGGIPDGIEKMTNLEYVNFQMTNLDCEIPKELFELPKLTGVYMQQCNLKGAVPTTLTQATKLFRFYIHENKLTSLPFVDVVYPGNSKISIEGNYFSFSDVAPYHAETYLKFVDNYQYVQDTENIDLKQGDQVTIQMDDVTGAKKYDWYKRTSSTEEIVAENAKTYTVSSVLNTDTYVCKVQGDVQNFDVRAYFVINSSGVATGIQEVKNSVVITPNPFDDYIRVKTDAEISSMTLYSITGDLVYNVRSIFVNQYEIPTSHIAKGLYMLKIETSKGTVVKKLLK